MESYDDKVKDVCFASSSPSMKDSRSEVKPCKLEISTRY
ncbi:hypothetical protein [Magpiepox virus 2]|nr:hypothetical protein [Magpiepox virus 2]QZW33676.1 hypothetical protein [Magpiepox virus 2]